AAVVDTNNRTSCPGSTLTASAYPSMAWSGPACVSCHPGVPATTGRPAPPVGPPPGTPTTPDTGVGAGDPDDEHPTTTTTSTAKTAQSTPRTTTTSCSASRETRMRPNPRRKLKWPPDRLSGVGGPR